MSIRIRTRSIIEEISLSFFSPKKRKISQLYDLRKFHLLTHIHTQTFIFSHVYESQQQSQSLSQVNLIQKSYLSIEIQMCRKVRELG